MRASERVPDLAAKIRERKWDEVDAEELKGVLRQLSADCWLWDAHGDYLVHERGPVALAALRQLVDALQGPKTAHRPKGTLHEEYLEHHHQPLAQDAFMWAEPVLDAIKEAERRNARLEKRGKYAGITAIDVLTERVGDRREAKEQYAHVVKTIFKAELGLSAQQVKRLSKRRLSQCLRLTSRSKPKPPKEAKLPSK